MARVTHSALVGLMTPAPSKMIFTSGPFVRCPLSKSATGTSVCLSCRNRADEIGRPLLVIASLIEEAGEVGLVEQTAKLMTLMDTASRQERASANGYDELCSAAWQVFSDGNFSPTARELASLMGYPSYELRAATVRVGKMMSHVTFLRKVAIAGVKHYDLEPDALANEVLKAGPCRRRRGVYLHSANEVGEVGVVGEVWWGVGK